MNIYIYIYVYLDNDHSFWIDYYLDLIYSLDFFKWCLNYAVSVTVDLNVSLVMAWRNSSSDIITLPYSNSCSCINFSPLFVVQSCSINYSKDALFLESFSRHILMKSHRLGSASSGNSGSEFNTRFFKSFKFLARNGAFPKVII